MLPGFTFFRRRPTEYQRIVPRPAHLTEDQILGVIGRVTQGVVVGTGNPDLLGLCGDRDQVEVAVKALTAASTC